MTVSGELEVLPPARLAVIREQVAAGTHADGYVPPWLRPAADLLREVDRLEKQQVESAVRAVKLHFSHRKTRKEKEGLHEELKRALAVIRSYEFDIRQRGLDKEGFCQGTFYEGAAKRIQEAVGGKP